MKCPQCEIPLLMTDRKGVEIDYCSQCRGIWLDKGELDKIITLYGEEFSREQPAAHEPPPPGRAPRENVHSHGGYDEADYGGHYTNNRHHHKSHHRHKKKKGLMDIFDIFD